MNLQSFNPPPPESRTVFLRDIDPAPLTAVPTEVEPGGIRPEWPAPCVRDEVVFAASPATVTRVTTPGDPDSQIDLVVYPGGKPQFVEDAIHDVARGWCWGDELQAHRQAELVASIRGDAAPRRGDWVRYAFASPFGPTVNVTPVRGKVLSVEAVPVLGVAEPQTRVHLRLFPISLPEDPASPDVPLDGENERLAFAVDLDNVSSCESHHSGRFEPLDGDQIHAASYFSMDQRTNCAGCNRRVSEHEVVANLSFLFKNANRVPVTHGICRECLLVVEHAFVVPTPGGPVKPLADRFGRPSSLPV